jgi:hypothetical protein
MGYMYGRWTAPQLWVTCDRQKVGAHKGENEDIGMVGRARESTSMCQRMGFDGHLPEKAKG